MAGEEVFVFVGEVAVVANEWRSFGNEFSFMLVIFRAFPCVDAKPMGV